MRLTMKPGVSRATTVVFPHASTSARAAAATAGALWSAGTISTSGITIAGLKKCTPSTRSGRRHADADDLLEPLEGVLLRPQVLDDRLDDEAAVSIGAEPRLRERAVNGDGDPREHLGRPRGVEAPLLDLALERLLDPGARPHQLRRLRVAEQHAMAGQRGDLRDPAPHRAGAEDADGGGGGEGGGPGWRGGCSQVMRCEIDRWWTSVRLAVLVILSREAAKDLRRLHSEPRHRQARFAPCEPDSTTSTSCRTTRAGSTPALLATCTGASHSTGQAPSPRASRRGIELRSSSTSKSPATSTRRSPERSSSRVGRARRSSSSSKPSTPAGSTSPQTGRVGHPDAYLRGGRVETNQRRSFDSGAARPRSG